MVRLSKAMVGVHHRPLLLSLPTGLALASLLYIRYRSEKVLES